MFILYHIAGKIRLDELREYPAQLKMLLTNFNQNDYNNYENSRNLRQNIRNYNCSFSFVLMGDNIQTRVGEWSRIPHISGNSVSNGITGR